MKQILLKTWLMLVMLLVGVGTSWAEDVTFSLGTTAGKDISSSSGTTKSNITVSFANGSGTALSWQTDHVRFYNGGSKVTISSTSTNITKIVISAKSGYTSADLKVGSTSLQSNSTKTEYTYTPASAINTVTITNNGSAQARLMSIVITAGSSNVPVEKPTNLSAGTPTSTGTTLSWDVVEHATAYKVEYKVSSAGAWTTASPNPTTNSCTLTGLTPSTTYAWQVTALSTETGYTDGSAQAGTNFTTAAPESHMAYFYVNGTLQNEGGTSFDEGAAIDFPADPAEISGKKFLGWTKNQNYSNATTAPSDMTKSATMGDADVTYYAVFATAAEGEDRWIQVTTLANIVEGKYVIKNGNFVLSNALASGSAPAALTAPTITNGAVTGTVEDNMIFNLTSTGTANQFYVKNPDGKYLYATNNNNGLRINTTQDKWTFDVNTTGYFSMKDANNSRYCAKYKDGSDWRSYTSATATNYVNGGKLELYKLTTGPTYSDYCTNVVNKALVSIAATGTPAEFWKGDAFNHDGITVTATWDDESTTDVTSSCSFTGYDTSTAGEQTVTVTYQGQTTTYNINVQTIANTQETAYTVAQAKALIDAGKDLATEVYVAGTISEIVTPWNEQYSNITYNISDDGETTGLQFQLFRCATNGGEVGDAVVAKGKMTFYSQTSTYEFTSGNTIVDIQKPAAKTITALEVSGTPTKTAYNVGDAFDPAGLTVTATYSDETTAPITTGFNWEIDYGTGNDALVAGATSVDVMVYTDEVMSEVYTVNGLTVTVPVTLTSIAVSGTPTKTEYYAGDAFETAGLVVTGTYSDSHQETITEGIEWTVDPETLTLGTTSVDVMAGVGSVVSEVYTVEGLTVTENPYRTATISSFTATSGDINTEISYEAFTGTSTSTPYINNGSLRLYQGGGYVTVTAVTGLKIASVKITTSGTYASTTVGYCVDDEEAPTTGQTVEKNSDYTINGLNNKSVSIYCLGTDKSTRLEISAIEVTYSGTPVVELSSIALSGTYPTEFTKGDEFSHEGMTVTANYTDGSDNEVTSEATFSGYDMNTIGEQTVTVSYTEDEITKTAQYTINVKKAPFVPTPATDGYETVDFAALYSSITTSATVEDYEGTSFAMAFAKPQSSTTPTKYYDTGKSVRAYVGNTITITAAENIFDVIINWSKEKGEDSNVKIEGIGTTSAVVTFSTTCSFTSITVDYREAATITLNAACTDGEKVYSTYSNQNAWIVPVGLTASEISITDGVLSIEEYAEGATVPANTGVMVSAAEGGDYTARLSRQAGTSVLGEANNLHPSSEVMSGNNMFYRLTMHNGTDIGFWWGAANGAAFDIPENKAYLAVPKSMGVNGMNLWFGNEVPTGIQSVATSAESSNICNDLLGRRLTHTTRGIQIINGKKVIR